MFILSAVLEVLGCVMMAKALSSRGEANFPLTFLSAIMFLIAFAISLTYHETAPGRAFAAYGGIYIVVSLGWMVWYDRVKILPTDAIGALMCIMGCFMFMISWNSK